MAATVGYGASRMRANSSCTATTRSARLILFAIIQSRSSPLEKNLPSATVTSALSPDAASTSSISEINRAIESKLNRFSVSPRLSTKSGPRRSRVAVSATTASLASALVRGERCGGCHSAARRTGTLHCNFRRNAEVVAGADRQREVRGRPAGAPRHGILERRHRLIRDADHTDRFKLLVQIGVVEFLCRRRDVGDVVVFRRHSEGVDEQRVITVLANKIELRSDSGKRAVGLPAVGRQIDGGCLAG